MPGAENGDDAKHRKKKISDIDSVCKRLRQLPESLYDIICNDYLGHHLYRINVHTLQHAIKIHYDAINVYIAGKNGIRVYNTDMDGLVYAVLRDSVLFRNIVPQ